MSETVGLLSFPEETKDSGKSPYSKTLKNLIDLEVRGLVSRAYYTTEKLLRDNNDKLIKVKRTVSPFIKKPFTKYI